MNGISSVGKRDQKLISARKQKREKRSRNLDEFMRNRMANDNWTELESDFIVALLLAAVFGSAGRVKRTRNMLRVI